MVSGRSRLATLSFSWPPRKTFCSISGVFAHRAAVLLTVPNGFLLRSPLFTIARPSVPLHARRTPQYPPCVLATEFKLADCVENLRIFQWCRFRAVKIRQEGTDYVTPIQALDL